jgi:predicted exporter
VRGIASGRRQAAIVLLAWGVTLAACLVLIARTPFSTDLSAFLPASPDPGQQLLIEQIRSGTASRTLLIGIEGASGPTRSAASRDIANTLRGNAAAFEQVANGDIAAFAAIGPWLVEHRYLLSPAIDAQHFSAAGLRTAIDDTLTLLGTPAGAAVKPLLPRDPTGEMARLAESLIPAQAPRSEGGVWVSRRAERAVMLAVTRADGGNLDAQAAAIDQVRSAFSQVQAALPGGSELRLLISGAPLFAVNSRSTIESEARQLSMIGTLVVGLLLALAFASLRALAVGLLPVASGMAAGIAAVALVFGNVHAMTLGFGATLIGETVDYAIYYLIQARPSGAGQAPPNAHGSGDPGWRRWLAQSWPTVRIGLLTSVCGFAALVFSGFPGLAQLGVFSIAGLIAAALTTRYLLPVLVPNGAPGRGLRRHMARIAGAIVHHLPRRRMAVAVLAIAAAGAIGWRGAGLWQSDLASLSPVSAAAQALDADLRADIGASDARTMVVARGPDAQTALAAAERAGAALDTLVDQGHLAGYDSPARLLPSVAVQKTRRAALPDEATLRERLIQATTGGALPADRLQPFVADVQAARTMAALDAESLRDTPIAALVGSMLMRSPDGAWTALLPLQPSGSNHTIDTSAVQAALAGIDAAQVQVIDIKHELDRLYAGYLREAVVQAGVGAAAVLLLLGLHLRALRRLVAVVLPLALAVLITLGALAAGGTAVGILHLVGLLLVVAVGSNYALFFDALQQRAALDDDTLASLLLANVTTVAAFGLIALSAMPALSAIGRVVAPGALLALLLAAAFGPRRKPGDGYRYGTI